MAPNKDLLNSLEYKKTKYWTNADANIHDKANDDLHDKSNFLIGIPFSNDIDFQGGLTSNGNINIKLAAGSSIINTVGQSLNANNCNIGATVLFCVDAASYTGIDNIMLRESIVYPHPHSDYKAGKPFELKNQGKLYYIDMNSSYMSFINGMPTDLTCVEHNYKINKLINITYNYRRKVKQSHPKLATTIKFLMNSCYGYSLRKPKLYKRKYTTNVNSYLNRYSPFVFNVYNINGDNEGYVHSKASFTPDYNTVQFGASILNNYHTFMNRIRSIVNVIYENIDAILINEDDYNKLLAAGYIGDNLGQFKIEHVFTSFKYISPRKWYAICDDGTIEKRGKWI